MTFRTRGLASMLLLFLLLPVQAQDTVPSVNLPQFSAAPPFFFLSDEHLTYRFQFTGLNPDQSYRVTFRKTEPATFFTNGYKGTITGGSSGAMIEACGTMEGEETVVCPMAGLITNTQQATVEITTGIDHAAAVGAGEGETLTLEVEQAGSLEGEDTVETHHPHVQYRRPEIEISTPANGSRVSGIIPFSGGIEYGVDAPRLLRVFYDLDSGEAVLSQNSAKAYFEEEWLMENTWQWPFDPSETILPNGEYRVEMRACDDMEGAVCGKTKTVTMIFQNDSTPPVILDLDPEEGSIHTPRRNFQVAVRYEDRESGVDAGETVLRIGNQTLPLEVVSVSADGRSAIVGSVLETPLAEGSHALYAQVFNGAGLATEQFWSFMVDSGGSAVEEEPAGKGIPPTAQLVATPSEGEGTVQVNFAYDCVQGQSPLQSCILDFGDGSPVESFGASGVSQITGNWVHTYVAREEEYVATLTARDGGGGTGISTHPVSVHPPVNDPPVIESLIAIPLFSEPVIPLFVNEGEGIKWVVEAQDPDGDPLTYTWDFGNGKIAETLEGEVYHAYYLEGEATGSFTTTLTVSDGLLETTAQISVTVQKALMKLQVVQPVDDPTLPMGKGDAFEVQVQVTDIFNALLEEKEVTSISAYLNDPVNGFALQRNPNGFYSGQAQSKLRFPNIANIFVVATGSVSGMEETAGTVSRAYFRPVEFRTEIETTPKVPYVGSVLEHLKIRLDYPDGTPVNGATVTGRIEGSALGNILFTETASGIYEADLSYPVGVQNEGGGILLQLRAVDAYGNGNSAFTDFRISTDTSNPVLNTLTAVIAVFFLAGIGFYLWNQHRRDTVHARSKLLRERQELEGMLKKLRFEYFKRHLTETEYKEKVLETEQQLITVQDLLGEQRTPKLKMSPDALSSRKKALLEKLNSPQKQEPSSSGRENALVTKGGKKKLYISPGEVAEIERELTGTLRNEAGAVDASRAHSLLSGILKRESGTSVQKTLEARFSESEREDIKRLVFLLRGKKAKFNRREMTQAILAEGYSPRIADKVVQILFKEKS